MLAEMQSCENELIVSLVGKNRLLQFLIRICSKDISTGTKYLGDVDVGCAEGTTIS